jgi:hypothetical protein
MLTQVNLLRPAHRAFWRRLEGPEDSNAIPPDGRAEIRPRRRTLRTIPHTGIIREMSLDRGGNNQREDKLDGQ